MSDDGKITDLNHDSMFVESACEIPDYDHNVDRPGPLSLHKPVQWPVAHIAETNEDLVAQFQEAEDEATRKLLLEELVKRNKGLVNKLLKEQKRFKRPQNILSDEDLRQEGYMALLQAVQRFDKTIKKVKFSTYASYWIKTSLIRALDKSHLTKLPNEHYRQKYWSWIWEMGEEVWKEKSLCGNVEHILIENTDEIIKLLREIKPESEWTDDMIHEYATYLSQEIIELGKGEVDLPADDNSIDLLGRALHSPFHALELEDFLASYKIVMNMIFSTLRQNTRRGRQYYEVLERYYFRFEDVELIKGYLDNKCSRNSHEHFKKIKTRFAQDLTQKEIVNQLKAIVEEYEAFKNYFQWYKEAKDENIVNDFLEFLNIIREFITDYHHCKENPYGTK